MNHQHQGRPVRGKSGDDSPSQRANASDVVFIYEGCGCVDDLLRSGATNQSVSWEHTDASGMSQRTTTHDGTALTAEGQYEGAPVETDPMGGNMGIATPYVEEPIILPPPEPDFPYLQNYAGSPTYLNGQAVTCSRRKQKVYADILGRTFKTESYADRPRLTTELADAASIRRDPDPTSGNR